MEINSKYGQLFFNVESVRLNHLSNTINVFTDNREERRNIDLRIKYLKNEIDDKKFANDIFHRMKMIRRNNEILQLFDMMKNTIQDYYRLISDKLDVYDIPQISKFFEEIEPLFNQIDSLIIYVNECLFKISKMYKTTHYIIYLFDNERQFIKKYNKN